MADPDRKAGWSLSDSVKANVIDLFESDEFSRLCPGKKDYITTVVNGKKVQVQKRLLLVNLNELYSEFKKRHYDTSLGLSKFCELRPKWCVPVGPKGTHSVCVCQYHQNSKLLVA